MCIALPGRVVATREEDGVPVADIDFGGVLRTACLAYEPEAVVGSYVLVNAGLAVAVVSEEEAARSFELMATDRPT